MAKGDSHMAKNVAKESCCIAPTLVHYTMNAKCEKGRKSLTNPGSG
jgi:hypothetical protein